MGERTVKNYKVTLKSVGRITQLPDSQKIFGALITALSRFCGAEEATTLVNAVFEKKSHIAVSNLLPLDYFPVPQDYIVDRLAEQTSKQESLKDKRAEVKARDFVKLNDLNRILKNPEKCKKIFPYVKVLDSYQQRASVESTFYGIEGLETKLYTVPVVTIEEVVKQNKGTNIVSEFCFYLQGDESVVSVKEVIEKFIQSEESIILGKRASQGLNKYKIISIEEIEIQESDYYLNLGMLLPEKIDFRKSTLRLFTSERRPFTMPGGWKKDSKYFISFIDSGSIIALKDKMEQAGKCVRSPFNQERDIIFGNAFLYPVILGKGESK